MSRVPLKPGYYWHGYKIKLYPTAEQAAYIDRCIELSSFVYNWALAIQKQQYKDYKAGKSKRKRLKAYTLFGMIKKLRHSKEYKWLETLPHASCCAQILLVERAYKFFLADRINNEPVFKKKKNSLTGSYGIRSSRLNFLGSKIKIEGLKSLIETHWDSGWYGHYEKTGSKKSNKLVGIPEFHTAAIVRNSCGEYFVCFSAQLPIHEQSIEFFDNDHVIGIDVNVKDRFVCSNGYRSGSPNLSKLERHKAKKNKRREQDKIRIEKWEKTNPGKTYVESNRAKRRHLQYAKAEQRIRNTVVTFIQTEAKNIIKMDPRIVVMEHLGVDNMKSKHHIAKQVQNAYFYYCKLAVKRKCEQHNITFIEAPRSFASSQICSRCGHRYKIGPEKTYICPHCNLVIDRDLNAAINLKQYALCSIT